MQCHSSVQVSLSTLNHTYFKSVVINLTGKRFNGHLAKFLWNSNPLYYGFNVNLKSLRSLPARLKAANIFLDTATKYPEFLSDMVLLTIVLNTTLW